MAIVLDENEDIPTGVSLFQTSEYVGYLEDMCLVHMIRDPSQQSCAFTNPMLSRLAVLTNAFRSMSDFERLASGCTQVQMMYWQENTPKMRFVNVWKRSRTDFTVVMGDEYVDMYAVFSSVSAFAILSD